MKLYAVKYAESTYPENRLFSGGNPDVCQPLYFTIFLIDVGDKRILIDAGCDSMPGWDMRYFDSPAIVMSRDGFPRESVTDIIITHHHHDHIHGIKHFPNAKIFIQEDEYELGKGHIREDRNVVKFKDEIEVVPGVTVKKIGGHSVGSCIVEICGFGDRITVISGDEIYHRKSLTDYIAVGNTRNPENSTYFVKEYSKDKYDVLIMHSADILCGRNGVVLIREGKEDAE